jgi:LysR family hydrogen peroxide-inducible transcriptional activator
MEYIVAVDKYRHFVRAAESCGVTQSTLSSLISKLEAELDVTIFDRAGHPVKPTALGEEIISQARVVLYNASQIEELISSCKGQSVGNLRLGIAPTIAPYILPKLLKILSQRYPEVHLTVEESRARNILDKIKTAELDVALLATPVEEQDLLEIPVYRERLVAYLSPDEKLYGETQLMSSFLSPTNVWVLREGYCPGNGGGFPFCQCRTDSKAVYEAGSIDTLVRIVDENGGYTIIPELHIPLLSEAQKRNIRPLVSPEPHRDVAFVIRKDFVRERMLNMLSEAVKDIIPEEMLDPYLRKFPVKL